MEKKELDSMSKLRGLFFSLGFAAMTGLMAGGAQAETLTLSVFAGTNTSATPIYSVTGGANSVTAVVGTLNSDLAGAGFGAYSFSTLGGSSNQPGSTTDGAFVLASGNLTVTPGGTGEGQQITVVLTEGGFTLPGGSTTLSDRSQSNPVGVSASSQASEGVFTPATGSPVIATAPTLGTTGGDVTGTHAIGAYTTPFSLESQTTLSLTGTSGAGNGSTGFSQRITVGPGAVVPEPASLVMMLTGMPLPLVVLGLLRRRRATA